MANENEEANDDVLEAIEDTEEYVEDLKEAIGEHPDQAIKTALTTEVEKFAAIFQAMRAALGQPQR